MRSEQLGRYKLLDELARAASGVLYKARDPLIDRIVAIKTVDVDLPRAEVEAFQKRLEREVRAAGRLNHPNIVTIHDIGRSGDVAYIAMEFMDGRSLREIFDSGAILPPARIADTAAQIADGLDFAHQHGIVHRDIKPDNIMVLRSGVIKITDFGIARLSVGSRTMIDASFGSAQYKSPEQVMGRTADERSDVFSLGAVLYEMLTGQPPFAGGELSQILHEVIHAMPVAPSGRNRSVAPAFDAIVAKAMAKNPNDRYRSAGEMALDLRNLAPGARSIRADVPAAAEPTTSRGQPGNACVLLDSPSVDIVTIDDSVSEEGTGVAAWFGHRRRLMFYGMSGAALLAAGGGWTLLSTRTAVPPMIDGEIAPSRFDDARPPSVKQEPVDGAPPSAPASAGSQPGAVPSPPLPPAPVVDKGISPAARRAARLALAVSPWGEVFVDGERKGVSPPLTEVRLAPGRYMVEIRNKNFRPYTQAVELGPNTRLRIKHKFK